MYGAMPPAIPHRWSGNGATSDRRKSSLHGGASKGDAGLPVLLGDAGGRGAQGTRSRDGDGDDISITFARHKIESVQAWASDFSESDLPARGGNQARRGPHRRLVWTTRAATRASAPDASGSTRGSAQGGASHPAARGALRAVRRSQREHESSPPPILRGRQIASSSGARAARESGAELGG